MFNSDKYGPWALIAGGSEGVAEAFAKRLGNAGFNLFLIARRPGPLEDLAMRIRNETGAQVRTLALDLTRADMLDRIGEATDDIDVGLLIYNAGGDSDGLSHFLDRPLESALHSLKLVALGETNLAHHFGLKMRERGRGGIILMGSLAGNVGISNLATYCAAKAYTQMFAEALWAELRPFNVDVLCFPVGATDTPNRTRQNTTEPEGMPLLSSDHVAAQALDDLDNGPVQTPRPLAAIFEGMCTPNRRAAVEAIADSVRPKE